MNRLQSADPDLAGISPDQQAMLAALLGGMAASPAPAPQSCHAGIEPVSVSRQRMPLSFAQQRMLVLQQLDPESCQYSIPIFLRLRGPLRLPALEQALTQLVARHETLRTVYAIEDSGPVQSLPAPDCVPIPLAVSVRSEDEPEESAIGAFIEREIRLPIDIFTGPVFRTSLLRLSADDNVLALVAHHIAIDGWSADVMIKELEEFYRASCEDRAPSLPPLRIQHADYAAWQRSEAQQTRVRSQLDYWRKRLSGLPPALELPTQKPRCAEHTTSAGAVLNLDVECAVQQDLTRVTRSEGASTFMGLLAVLTAFLSRYSGQQDIAIGTPVAADRDLPELAGTLGLLVNTLVMRNSTEDNPTFRELLRRVRDNALEAFENSGAPFEKLVDEIQPTRDLSRTPLFQVFLSLQNGNRFSDGRFAGLEAAPVSGSTHTAKFELTFAFREEADAIRGGLTYSTALFDDRFAERMAANFRKFLAAAAASPDTPISDLPLLADEERQRVLKSWNATSRDYGSEPAYRPLLHQWFEDQAHLYPGRTAIRDHGEEISYAALQERASAYAARILNVTGGSRQETFVAVCLPRTAELIAALLGVLKAGCAFLALDASYPFERLAGMMEDARPACLITTADLSVHLPPEAVRIFAEAPGAPPEHGASQASPVVVNPESAAYLIYTSGSTGKPKGTVISHRSAVTLVAWAQETFPPSTLQGILASTSTCFDLSIFEIFVPLSSGGAMILAENALELPELPAADREQIRLVNTVPSAITELLRIGGVPESVDIVNLAGEALPRPLVSQIHALSRSGSRPGPEVYNLYGPTEDTTYSTCAQLARESQGPVSIGRPIANTRTYVLNPVFQAAPEGVTGEIYIAGEGLARGYLNQPGMTASRFLPDPFGPPGSRMYRTGDLGRWRADGELDYLGRVDHQVKIRGFRIELGEIESALAKREDIERVAVVAREDRPGDKRLVAYFIPRHQRESGGALPQPTERDLRTALAKTLPDFMIPSAFVSMAAFPLTANGKIDRKAFAPPAARPELQQRYMPANDPFRSQLVAIWESLLHISPIGIRDDFFRIGGDSLLAVQLVHRIRQECGVKAPLGILFRHPTIESMATALIEREADTWASPVVQIQSGDPSRRAPFFYLHADFVSGGFYSFDLARRLSSEQPFYILQPHGLDGGDVPISIEEMAAQRLADVRRIQPHGPYYLGGKCNGSLIAFEMARMLEEQGEEVRLVAIVHGWAGALYNRVEQTFKAAPRPPKQELMNSRSYQTRKMWAFYRYMWAIKTYMPKPYGGKLHLLWPKEIPIKGGDPTLCWSKVAATVDVRTIPGDAYTCITRHIDDLAAQIESLLAQTQAPK